MMILLSSNLVTAKYTSVIQFQCNLNIPFISTISPLIARPLSVDLFGSPHFLFFLLLFILFIVHKCWLDYTWVYSSLDSSAAVARLANWSSSLCFKKRFTLRSNSSSLTAVFKLHFPWHPLMGHFATPDEHIALRLSWETWWIQAGWLVPPGLLF